MIWVTETCYSLATTRIRMETNDNAPGPPELWASSFRGASDKVANRRGRCPKRKRQFVIAGSRLETGINASDGGDSGVSQFRTI